MTFASINWWNVNER